MVVACLAVFGQSTEPASRFVLLRPEAPYLGLGIAMWDRGGESAFRATACGAISPDGATVIVDAYYDDQSPLLSPARAGEPPLQMTAPIFRATVWHPGAGPRLTPFASREFETRAVLDDGTVLGGYDFFDDPHTVPGRTPISHAYLVRKGALTMLAPAVTGQSGRIQPNALGGQISSADAYAITADGSKVFGKSREQTLKGNLFAVTEWENGQPRPLTPWSEGDCDVADVSPDGEYICGNLDGAPYVMEHGALQRLDTGRSAGCVAMRISDDGVVFGSDSGEPAAWRNGRLALLPKDPSLAPGAIRFTGLTGSGAFAVGYVQDNTKSPLELLSGAEAIRSAGGVVYDGAKVRPFDEFLAKVWGLQKQIEGYKLICPLGISKDGNEIVGDAVDSHGVQCVFAAFRK